MTRARLGVLGSVLPNASASALQKTIASRRADVGSNSYRLLADFGCQIFDCRVIRFIWLTWAVLYYS